MTADSLQKQGQAPGGRLFQKGRSGNPNHGDTILNCISVTS